LTLCILAEAETEILAARDFLDARTYGLGARFLDDLSKTLAGIVDRPVSFAILETLPGSEYRRALLSTFRYVVVFEIEHDEIIVVAVAHGSRMPNYWLGRRG
jgi:plasmid stabilization system protein ParE